MGTLVNCFKNQQQWQNRHAVSQRMQYFLLYFSETNQTNFFFGITSYSTVVVQVLFCWTCESLHCVVIIDNNQNISDVKRQTTSHFIFKLILSWLTNKPAQTIVSHIWYSVPNVAQYCVSWMNFLFFNNKREVFNFNKIINISKNYHVIFLECNYQFHYWSYHLKNCLNLQLKRHAICCEIIGKIWSKNSKIL